jgi:hypothetical protein
MGISDVIAVIRIGFPNFNPDFLEEIVLRDPIFLIIERIDFVGDKLRKTQY